MSGDTSDIRFSCTAFAGHSIIAEGNRREVARKLAIYSQKHPEEICLVFDNQSSALVEFDLRGSVDEVLARLDKVEAEPVKAGPGRPKLGVVSREIGLLPRHWEWLAGQPGGASVTLRRLVEEAKKANRRQDEKREAQNAAYRFMSAMAGNLPHFEEALRAFFAGDRALFSTLTTPWPKDVRKHALRLSEPAFEGA